MMGFVEMFRLALVTEYETQFKLLETNPKECNIKRMNDIAYQLFPFKQEREYDDLIKRFMIMYEKVINSKIIPVYLVEQSRYLRGSEDLYQGFCLA
ncbi:hypothetical protein PQC38_gp007 [Aeromonas phage BUCT695]|uniref:hypothetical protein n=1 Tax=Aeromonas phage BUCT695 TaxID=2908630 RepID=UPI0023294087|nr:hypothetical protein PQC38_gp007 [Aeromonas phage BUCT695]UIW10483.1 hypothetical protein [Aeromonas phage BUCT695]